MPDQQESQPSPPRKKQKYSPWSIVTAPLGLPIALTFGKALGEAMEWGKPATIAAECVIGAAAASLSPWRSTTSSARKWK